jgi:DNA mismatch endonuclease Vsr
MRSEKLMISKEELEKLYSERKYSVNKLAKIFNVDNNTIKKRLLLHNLPYRGIGKRKNSRNLNKPCKEILTELYNTLKLTLEEIGQKFGVTSTQVGRWFRFYSIPRRSTYRSWIVRKNITLPSKEQLTKDYESMSLELIAKKYGLSSLEPVLNLIKKYEIKKRTRSESRKLAIAERRAVSWNKGKGIEDPQVAKTITNLHKKHMEKIDEARSKQSKYWKKAFQERPELKERMRQLSMKSKPKYKNTKPERLMKDILESENLMNGLVQQHPIRIKDFITIPDFAYPEKKIAIYCDGEFWHGGHHHLGKNLEEMQEGPRKDKIKEVQKKDGEIHYLLWSNGWVPLRFWQHEIEKHPKNVIEKIRKNLFDEEFIKKREKERLEAIKVFREWGKIQ